MGRAKEPELKSKVLKRVSFSSHPSNFWPLLTSASGLRRRGTYSPSAEAWRTTNLETLGDRPSLLGLKSLLCLHWMKASSPVKGTWEPLRTPHHAKSELRAASREGLRPNTRGLGFPAAWALAVRTGTLPLIPSSPSKAPGRSAWWEKINSYNLRREFQGGLLAPARR